MDMRTDQTAFLTSTHAIIRTHKQIQRCFICNSVMVSLTCRPLLEGSAADGAWDGEVGGPCAVPMAEGRYRVYYSGRRRTAATEDGSDGSSEGGSDSRPWEGFGLALNPAEATGQGQLFEGMRTDFQRLVPKQTNGE
jgi:hypothetical protein